MGTLSTHPLAKLLVLMLPMNWLFSLLPSVINSGCDLNPALSSAAKITHKKRKQLRGMALHTGLSKHCPGWVLEHPTTPQTSPGCSCILLHSLSRLRRHNLQARWAELAVLSNTQGSVISVMNSSVQCLKIQFTELLQITTAGLWKWASKFDWIQQDPNWFSL